MSEYEFPEVFVEGVEGDYYIVYKDGEYFFSKTPGGEKYYGHILYEDVVEKAVDLVEAKMKKSIIVIPKFRPSGELEAILVEEGTSICLMEIKGADPIVFVSEGDEVEERDKIAYIITGKGEVRVYKSVCSGIVTLVINFPWERPERYILVVVSKDDARRIIVKRS